MIAIALNVRDMSDSPPWVLQSRSAWQHSEDCHVDGTKVNCGPDLTDWTLNIWVIYSSAVLANFCQPWRPVKDKDQHWAEEFTMTFDKIDDRGKKEAVEQNDKGKKSKYHHYASLYQVPSHWHFCKHFAIVRPALRMEWMESVGCVQQVRRPEAGSWGVTLSKIAPPPWWPSEGWKSQEQEQRQQRQQQQEQEEGKEYCRQGRGRRLRGKRGNREIRWRKMRRNWTIPEICAIAGFVSGTWFVNPTTVAFHASWEAQFLGSRFLELQNWIWADSMGFPCDFRSKFEAPPPIFFDHFPWSFHLQKVRHLDWKPPKRRANVRESVMSRPGTWCTWTNPTLGQRCLIGF